MFSQDASFKKILLYTFWNNIRSTIQPYNANSLFRITEKNVIQIIQVACSSGTTILTKINSGGVSTNKLTSCHIKWASFLRNRKTRLQNKLANITLR